MSVSAPLVAAIPVRNQLEWTRPLVMSLLEDDEVDQVWLFDNGSTDDTATWAAGIAAADPRFTVTTRPRARLYGMWNEMVARASLTPNTHLAILNNDLTIPHGALRLMQQAMEGYDLAFLDRERGIDDPLEPDPIEADWTDRTGWAFMLRSDFWRGQPYAIDPGLRIWWGDDDLARRAQARGGRLSVVRGIGCFHAISQTTYPGDMAADTEHDRLYFRHIWDDG